jgi:hypothetical protein
VSMERRGAQVNGSIALAVGRRGQARRPLRRAGPRIAWSSQRLAQLAMADGSAAGAQGSGLPARPSAPFDAELERAVRTGGLAALLAIDQGLARELMATGHAHPGRCWPALPGLQPVSEIWYYDEPFGVAYLVASQEVPQLPS